MKISIAQIYKSMRAAATPARPKDPPTLTMEPPAVGAVVEVVPPVVVPEEPPVVVEPPGALLAVWAEASCLKEAREREALAAVL